jgi:hypothetical protein
MKKAVVLGMILLALSCMAYAEGVTVGFDFGRTQFVVAQAAMGSGAFSGTPTDLYQGWVPGSGTFPTIHRYDMQFAWSTDKVGINMTAYIGNGLMTTNWVNMYGTLKLMPDLFTMYIGRFEGDGWDHFRADSAHPIHDVDNSSVGRFSGWGIILDLMPKDMGFDAAVFVKTLDPTSTTPVGGNQLLADQMHNYGVAASYTVPNMVKLTAGSTTFSTAPFADRNVFGRVELLMVPNLTLWDDFWYAGFDQPVTYTKYSDELALQYKMDALTIVFAGFYQANAGGTILGVAFPAGQIAGSDVTILKFYPEVYYNLGAFTVGLYFGYQSITSSALSNGVGIMDLEPYIKINDFNLRISFHYFNATQGSDALGGWEIPIIIDWGF